MLNMNICIENSPLQFIYKLVLNYESQDKIKNK